MSIQNGTLIYTYDDRGDIVGTPISTVSQGTIESDATNDRESSRYSNRGNSNTSDFGFIDGYIESLTNYVYRKGWSQKSIFGKLLTLILLPFAVCISAIQIAFTILRWLLIAAVILVVLYVFYIGIFSWIHYFLNVITTIEKCPASSIYKDSHSRFKNIQS